MSISVILRRAKSAAVFASAGVLHRVFSIVDSEGTSDARLSYSFALSQVVFFGKVIQTDFSEDHALAGQTSTFLM